MKHPFILQPWIKHSNGSCEFVKKLNIQVFLTSHNKEAIDKILKCDPEITKDIAVYTLSKINGKTVARKVSGEKAIVMQNEMGLELR